MMQPPVTEIPRIHIYTPSILSVIGESRIDIDAFLEQLEQLPDSNIRHYPDGSVQIEGAQATAAFKNNVGGYYRKRALDFSAKHPLSSNIVLGGAAYLSLSPFPLTFFDLSLFGELLLKLESGCIRIRPGFTPSTRPNADENPIENLPVTILFQRRLSKDTRLQFANLVGDWLASVRDKGMFEEGPILPISREIDFFPRCAQFRIDASQSGQNTINWLILSILQFMPVNLVTDILLVEREDQGQSIAEAYSLSAAHLVRLSIPYADVAVRATTATDKLILDAQPESHVPPEALPYDAPVQSELFRLLALPDYQIENLTTSIYFEEMPKAKDREIFQKSIDSWLSLGSLGAFGNGGFHAYGKVAFEEQTASARFWCDVGVTDWNLAFTVLVNLFEGLHRQGLTIEAVVLS